MMKTEGVLYEYHDVKFRVMPEYTRYRPADYIRQAEVYNETVIGGLHLDGGLAVAVFDPVMDDYRLKHRLTSAENEAGVYRGKPPRIFNVGNRFRILPIICYELLFPQDYYGLSQIRVDFITHHVGYPMYDRHQMKAWVALQQAASLHFRCPLISVCGGEDGPMNITHVIDGEEVFEYV